MNESCKACGGTGINSKGGVCYPCQQRNKTVGTDAVYFIVSRDDMGAIIKHAGPYKDLETATQGIPIIMSQCNVFVTEERDGKQEPVAKWKDGKWLIRK